MRWEAHIAWLLPQISPPPKLYKVKGQVWGPLAEGVKNSFCSVSQLLRRGPCVEVNWGKLVSGGGRDRAGADLEDTGDRKMRQSGCCQENIGQESIYPR